MLVALKVPLEQIAGQIGCAATPDFDLLDVLSQAYSATFSIA
jgi:hypothetical protein